MTFAGEPTMSEFGGKTFPCVTNAPAPTIDSRPMTALSRITAPIPIKQKSSTVHACTMALCPTVTSEPMTHGAWPEVTCTVLLS